MDFSLGPWLTSDRRKSWVNTYQVRVLNGVGEGGRGGRRGVMASRGFYRV